MSDFDSAAPAVDDGRMAAPKLAASAIFLRFLRFGATAWGGPTVQIANLRDEYVDRAKWLSPERFARTLAVYQALPGPEAHELCCHLGLLAGGRVGAIAAGMGFMLPGFLAMLGAAWLYVALGLSNPSDSSAWVIAAFATAQAAIAGLVLKAAWSLSMRLARGPLLACAALVAFVMQLFGIPFWFALGWGAAIGTSARRPAIAAFIALTALVPIVWFATPAPAQEHVETAAREHGNASLPQLFQAGLTGGLTSFGGAYTAVPVVRDQSIGARGWMSEREFLDGFAIATILPAPLVIFVTFVGYLGGGAAGAVVATFAMFLPAFGFTLLGARFFDAILRRSALHGFLDGIAAAAAGLIAATAIVIARGVVGAPWDSTRWWAGWVILIAATILAARWRSAWTAPVAVLGAAALGLLLHALPA